MHLYEKLKVSCIRFRVHIVFEVTATERNQQKQASS